MSGAEYFAKGSIDILNKLNIIDSICFGSECGDIQILEQIADILVKKENYIWNKTTQLMKSGNSFATSRELCLKEVLNQNMLKEICKSNNILAIEYIKAIKKINSNIKTYTIKREGNEFNDITIAHQNSFASATSIREAVFNQKFTDIENTVPNETLDLIQKSNSLSNEAIFHILKYKIISDKDILNKFNGVIEGLENKILSAINISNTYTEFIHNIKSKRYAMSSIKRMLLNILLNISKEDFNQIKNNNINYAHILSISEKGKNLLSQISKKSNIKVLTNINNDIINDLDNISKKSLELDIYATNIYNSLLNENINKDYTNKL